MGLYYYGARWYDPALGRFAQADTLVPGMANPQNLNRYSYVLNNPLRYTDPTGHCIPGVDCPIPDDEPEKSTYTWPPDKEVSSLPPGGRMYSEEERLSLARTMWGEEGALGAQAMIAVGWVAVNRLLEWGYADLVATITDVEYGVQFQGYWRTLPAPGSGEYAVYAEAIELAAGLLRGEYMDPTYGATYMGNYELGSKQHQAAQSWSAYFPEDYQHRVFLPKAQGPSPLIVANFEYHNLRIYPPLPLDPPRFPK